MYESGNRIMNSEKAGLSAHQGCVAAREGFCARFEKHHMAELCATNAFRRYRAGTNITLADMDTGPAMIVREGIISIVHTFGDGRRQVLDLLFPGDLLLQDMSDANDGRQIQAACEVVTCEISQGRLFQLGLDVPEIGKTLFDVLREFITRKNTHLLDLGRKRADERVASFLLEYRRRATRENADMTTIKLMVPRSTIADFLCLTRETVSRSFTQLREEGLINLNNHDEIDIIDFEALCRRASGDDSVGP